MILSIRQACADRFAKPCTSCPDRKSIHTTPDGARLVTPTWSPVDRRLRLIDRDRIEERNLSTQPWRLGDIRAFKAMIPAHDLYRAVGAKVEGIAKELTQENRALFLKGSDVIVDAFDNSVGRSVLKDWGAVEDRPCLHVGLAPDYAEVIWNEEYRIPSPASDDVCDYPLARNLVMTAAAVACETLIRFLVSGRRENRTITFGDYVIGHL